MVELDSRVRRDPGCRDQPVAENDLFIFGSDTARNFAALARHGRPVDRHLPYRDGRRATAFLHLPLARPHAPPAVSPTRCCMSSISIRRWRGLACGGACDRPIDGVDQLAFLLGQQSIPTGRLCLLHQGRLRAASGGTGSCISSGSPNPPGAGPSGNAVAFQTAAGPKEETDVGTQASWVRGPMRRWSWIFRVA